jgi:hypothetical protein
MPCDGVAVLTAETSADLEKHFAEPLHREQFNDWLHEQGIAAHGWWETRWGWALDLTASGSTGLRFLGSSLQIVGRLTEEESDRITALVQFYAGQVAQQQVVEALAALGFIPQDLAYDTNAQLTFTIYTGV